MPSNIGKIAGPMLVDNLERLGANLSIETDVIYFDVINGRVGIKNTTPTNRLSVDGTADFTGDVVANNFVGPQITITNNTVTVTESNANLVLSPNGTGVINGSAVRVANIADPTDDQDAATKYYVDDRIENHVTTIQAANSSITVVDTVNGNINLEDGGAIVLEPGGLLLLEDGSSTNVAGNIVTTVDGNVVQYARAEGVTTLTPATVQNINIAGNTVSSVDVNGNINLQPNGVGTVVVDSATALLLPLGTTGQRPASPVAGQTRFNTSTGFLEFYNGTEWVNASADTLSVISQTVVGNGSTTTFALDESTTTEGIIVSINGTVQRPYVAYEVIGGNIVFAEPPVATDFVDIRYIAVGYSISEVYLPVLSKSATLSLPAPTVGQMVYVSDGDAGSPCLAVYNGASWKVINFGVTLA